MTRVKSNWHVVYPVGHSPLLDWTNKNKLNWIEQKKNVRCDEQVFMELTLEKPQKLMSLFHFNLDWTILMTHLCVYEHPCPLSVCVCVIRIIFWNPKPFRKLKLDFASFKFVWKICKSGAQHRCAPNLTLKKNICRHDDIKHFMWITLQSKLAT